MLYIFKEYERITKKKDQLLTNDITQDLLLKILLSDDLNKSNDDLKEYYECFSEEIDNIFKMIKQKKVNVFAKLTGSGWGGSVAVFGSLDSINMLNSRFHSVYINIASN